MKATALNEKGALAAAPAAAAPLPCLGSNNSIGELENPVVDAAPNGPAIRVSKGAFKTEHCLKENIRLAVVEYGLETLGFFTLTFAKPVYSAEDAQKRMNSLLTNIIRPRYGKRYIGVMERHESGAIHFHFILHVATDIRTGFDWSLAEAAYAEARKKNFAKSRQLWSAAAASAVNGNFLRKEWAFWRAAKNRYAWLGRCQLLPVQSTGEAIAKYTGGYIAKHMQHRREEDKGVRLVRYGKEMRWVNSRIAFNSTKARLYRRKLAAFVAQPHIQAAGVREYEDMRRVFGKRWGYHLLIPILSTQLGYYATSEEAWADGINVPPDCVDIRIEHGKWSDAEAERYDALERRKRVARSLLPSPGSAEADGAPNFWCRDGGDTENSDSHSL